MPPSIRGARSRLLARQLAGQAILKTTRAGHGVGSMSPSSIQSPSLEGLGVGSRQACRPGHLQDSPCRSVTHRASRGVARFAPFAPITHRPIGCYEPKLRLPLLFIYFKLPPGWPQERCHLAEKGQRQSSTTGAEGNLLQRYAKALSPNEGQPWQLCGLSSRCRTRTSRKMPAELGLSQS